MLTILNKYCIVEVSTEGLTYLLGDNFYYIWIPGVSYSSLVISVFCGRNVGKMRTSITLSYKYYVYTCILLYDSGCMFIERDRYTKLLWPIDQFEIECRMPQNVKLLKLHGSNGKNWDTNPFLISVCCGIINLLAWLLSVERHSVNVSSLLTYLYPIVDVVISWACFVVVEQFPHFHQNQGLLFFSNTINTLSVSISVLYTVQCLQSQSVKPMAKLSSITI